MKQRSWERVDWGRFWPHELSGYRPVESRGSYRSDSPFTGRHKSKPFVAQGPVYCDHSILDGSERGGNAINFLMKFRGLTYRQALRYLSRFFNQSRVDTLRTWRKPSEKIVQANSIKFTYREIVEGGLFKRVDSSRIKEFPKTPDFYGDPSAIDCFYSHFLHSADIVAYAAQNGGKVAGYSGPVDIKHPTIDIDHNEDLAKAQEIAVRVYRQLREFGIPRHHIHPFFSGYKGFHIMFYTPELKKLARYQTTPYLVRCFVKKITEPVVSGESNVYIDKHGKSHKIIDDAIYSCTSLVRAPNSRHGSSGLYKIPISEPELMNLSAEAIREMARTQRPIGVPLSSEGGAA